MIEAIITGLKNKLGIAFIEANNNSSSQAYPHGSYLITRVEFEAPHQRIRKQEVPNKDSSDVTIKNTYEKSISLQISFHHKGTGSGLQEVLMTHAMNAWHWLNEEGRSICKQNGVVLQKTNPKITPDVTESNGEALYRVSFDITLKGKSEHTSTIEVINSVNFKE